MKPVSDANEPVKHSSFTRSTYWLFGLFLIILCSRLLFTDTRLPEGGDSLWQITYAGEIDFQDESMELLLSPVRNSAHITVVSQSIYHPQLKQKRSKSNVAFRTIVLAPISTGKRQFSVTFDVYLSHQPRLQLNPALKENSRERWLRAEDGIFTDAEAAIDILTRLGHIDSEPADKARALYEHVSETIAVVNNGPDDGEIALSMNLGTALGASRALASLLRSSHLPSRLVTGIDLGINERNRPHHWVETYYQGRWHAIDVARGNFDDLPRELVPITRSSTSIARLSNAEPPTITITSQPHPEPYGLEDDDDPLQILKLSRISPDGKIALILLMLLPLGVLITEIFRQYVGIRTFGTFTPSLLALSLVYTDIPTAVVVFSLVIGVGVIGRSFMPGLNLSKVARLSVVFTMVAGIMAFAVSGLLYFNPALDTAVVLLPIVVLTSLIDRFYSVADENSLAAAIKRLLWTLSIAALAMLVLSQDRLGNLLLAYPEVHLLTVALIIAAGRYQGKKLVDDQRFRWLAESRRNQNR